MSDQRKKVHFIAIGGSVMHQLALHCQQQGWEVSGSDDAIFGNAAENLKKTGLLPEQMGWFPDKISNDLDLVILGMHAQKDNPELVKAQDLGLEVMDFPSFIYSQCKQKQRVVIGGSHGKTTITAMIMHVLNYTKKSFDYLVGAPVPGFDTLVRLSDAPMVILEGDEYPSSRIDPTPKFIKYQHHIGLISGVSWDHMNVFPTLDDYVQQFEQFADETPKGGQLVFCADDAISTVICRKERPDVGRIEYEAHPYEVKNGKYILKDGNDRYPLKIFGKHNMYNLEAAREVCQRLGVIRETFYEAIQSFKGADRRLQLISEEQDTVSVYTDFAHAPSKFEASIEAVKELHPERHLTACFELHTYSSLNKKFIGHYSKTSEKADRLIIYYNPEALKIKKMEPLSEKDLQEAFERDSLELITDPQELRKALIEGVKNEASVLMMSSGNFGGLDLYSLGQEINQKA